VKRPCAVGTALAALTVVITSLPFAQGVSPAALAEAEPTVSGLHVVGNQIQNGAGERVRLIGVNRSSAEYECSSNDGIFDGPADQSEVTAMQSWHIKAVRVVLNEDCWLGINGVSPVYSGIQYQNTVAAYVNLLTGNNIAVIINLHFNAPGSQLATGQQAMADVDHSPAFWLSVAARFKNNSSVLFEPYNEPHPDGGNSSSEGWRCWRDGGACTGVPFTAAGMQQLVTVIRATGATNIIILTGQNWGSQLDQWLQYKPNDPINQLAAGWHSYGDGLDCQDEACWNSTLKTVLQQVPIVATEIGEFDCGHAYIDQVMAFLDQYGQGYLAWSWGPFSCAQDPALLSDWSGTPTQTYGQGLKDHLTSIGGGDSDVARHCDADDHARAGDRPPRDHAAAVTRRSGRTTETRPPRTPPTRPKPCGRPRRTGP
jgi:endoglucanase